MQSNLLRGLSGTTDITTAAVQQPSQMSIGYATENIIQSVSVQHTLIVRGKCGEQSHNSCATSVATTLLTFLTSHEPVTSGRSGGRRT